jgi:hypothetical protein
LGAGSGHENAADHDDVRARHAGDAAHQDAATTGGAHEVVGASTPTSPAALGRDLQAMIAVRLAHAGGGAVVGR